MRLDKYLKVSRLIKRRTVANEACDAGRVLLNDKVARASADVKIGDVIKDKDLEIAKNPNIDLKTDPEAVVVTVTRAHNAPVEEETEETDADAAADTKKDAAKKEEK